MSPNQAQSTYPLEPLVARPPRRSLVTATGPKMWGPSEGAAGGDLDGSSNGLNYDSLPSYFPAFDEFSQLEGNVQSLQKSTGPKNPSAPPFASLSSGNGRTSEAISKRQSPGAFTTNNVMGSHFMLQRNSTKATPSFQNRPFFPRLSNSLIHTSCPQQSSKLPHKASVPRTHRHQASAYPLGPLLGQPLSGPGIVSLPHNAGFDFLTIMNEDIFKPIGQQGSAEHAILDTTQTKSAQMSQNGAEADQGISTDLETTYNISSGEDSAASGHTSAFHNLPRQRTQNNRDATQYPSDIDHNNLTSHSTSNSSSSLGSNHSSQSMTAFSRTSGGMPKSSSCPTFAPSKKHTSPLTDLQMVNEANHQPTMEPVQVFLILDKNKPPQEVQSMDYRDSSWQGRSDEHEHKGWTPYLDFADFPDTMEMLQTMRNNPYQYMPDHATIFTSIEEVGEWREEERKKACRNSRIQEEEELPRSQEEKAAIVKLLFKAFKTTIHVQSNENIKRPFEHQIHSNAHVEAVCWQLVEAAIKRSEGGALSYAFEPEKASKCASDRSLGFTERIDYLIQALKCEKSVCNNLLKAPKVYDIVDCPGYISKRTANNRALNGRKAEVTKVGKQVMAQMQQHEGELPRRIEAASRPSLKRGKRAIDNFDDDSSSESTGESLSKRHSPERASTPQFARPAAAFDLYPPQGTPLSHAAKNKPSYPGLTSSGQSTTGSLRADMTGYNLNDIKPPNFGRSTLTISPSPLHESDSLGGVGAQHLPASEYIPDYSNGFLSINHNDEDMGFGL